MLELLKIGRFIQVYLRGNYMTESENRPKPTPGSPGQENGSEKDENRGNKELPHQDPFIFSDDDEGEKGTPS